MAEFYSIATRRKLATKKDFLEKHAIHTHGARVMDWQEMLKYLTEKSEKMGLKLTCRYETNVKTKSVSVVYEIITGDDKICTIRASDIEGGLMMLKKYLDDSV